MNDTWKEFYDLYEAIGRAYISSDAYDITNNTLHKLIKRLILLDKKQKAERKAIEEAHTDYLTINDFFGFCLPKWKPPLDASNEVCRQWVSEFFNLFKSSPLGKHF